MANLIKTAQFEELIYGRKLDCASARRSAGIRSSLHDAGEAEEYVNAAVEESDPELFLLVLRNVAEVQGGVAHFAEKAKLNRESLDKILSERAILNSKASMRSSTH